MIISMIYLIIILLIALLGVYLIRRGLRKHRRMLLVLAGLTLIVAPFPADLIFTRIVHVGESPTTAWVPTTIMLSALETKADGTYGVIFDRFHNAPARHAFWSMQSESLAAWCLACVRSGDPAMVKRGVQISAKLAIEHDAAIKALGEALDVGVPEVRMLACDILMSIGARAVVAKPQLESAATKDDDETVRLRAKSVLDQLKDLSQ